MHTGLFTTLAKMRTCSLDEYLRVTLAAIKHHDQKQVEKGFIWLTYPDHSA